MLRFGKFGFTLIELLIVVAIIAILAAIAVPNFLEAQVRSKIARVRADARSVATALEAYMVDYNSYPHPSPDSVELYFVQYIPGLTTPASYMTTTILPDPFAIYQTESGIPVWGGTAVIVPRADWKQTLYYFTYDGTWAAGCSVNWGQFYPRKAFSVFSHGPSKYWSGIEHYPIVLEHPELISSIPGVEVYDASNGTKSMGGIARFGGNLRVQQTP